MRMRIETEVIQKVISCIGSTVPSDHDIEGLMVLKDDRWLMKMQSADTTRLAAVLVPGDAMESYDRGGYDQIGMPLSFVESFTGEGDMMDIWMEDRQLHVDAGGGYRARRYTIDPDSINGIVRQVPDLDFEVSIKTDPDFILDFINKSQSAIGADSYMIGARESGLFIYADYDNGQLNRHIPWSDFDDVDIDWSVNNSPGHGHTPEEDHAVDTILGIDITKEFNFLDSEESYLQISNHMPIKMIFTDEDGVMYSYIQTPRISDPDSVMSTIPTSVTEEYE